MSEQFDNQIIEKLYDLVSAPEQYDEFMLTLQNKLDNLKGPEGQHTAGVVTAHMKRAAALVDIVTPWRRNGDEQLHSHLAQRMQPTFAVDWKGHVLDANSAAKVLYNLESQSTLRDLPIAESEKHTLLSQVRLLHTQPDRSNHPNNVLKFIHNSENRPLLVKLEPYTDSDDSETIVIVRTNDIGWPAHLGPIVQDLFNVTYAELEVMRHMVEGHKVKDIARLRSCSTTTVRSQLQSIFQKTDTADQMECVRMIFGLALLHEMDEGKLVAARIEAAQETEFFPREEQRKLFRLPGGRQLEYSDFGDADGRVVLFYHDQAFGDVWFKRAVEQAKSLGLRIVAPLRPGFGQTSLYQGNSSEPLDFAPDVKALLEFLEIERVTILSLSSGLVHALAAVKLMPNKICAITACHPLLPVLSDQDLEGTNGYNYLIPHARLHFPQAIKFLCKAGFAFVMRSGPEAFGKAVMRASPHDVEWISRPDILPVMAHGRRIHQDQGYLGNFGDINYSEDWSDLLNNCTVPVKLVIGEQDRNVQWGSARRWSDSHEHISLHILPDSGYMVHHQQYEQVLDWLSSDLSIESN